MTIVALRTGRDRHPLHPVLTTVSGTERAVAAALLAEAPGATALRALPGRTPVSDAAAAPAWDDRPATRARIDALAERLDVLDARAATALPDAGPVARGLDALLVARSRAAAARPQSPDAARTRLAHAEAHLAHVEQATQRRAVAVSEGGGLEELHLLLVGLEQRAAGPLARRSFRRRVAALPRDEERALLARLGFASYSEFRATIHDADASPSSVGRARRSLERARTEVVEAEQVVARHDERLVAEATARLVGTLEASGPVPDLDGDAPQPAARAADGAPVVVDDVELEHHARAWLAALTRAEARRRHVDAERRELAAELTVLRAGLAEADAIAAAEARLHEPAPAAEPAAVDVELAVLAALAAHRRVAGGHGPFVVDGALDDLDDEARTDALDLLASLRGTPQVVLLTDRAEVVAWADGAHPGRAAALRLDGRIPTRLEIAEEALLDLDALAAEVEAEAAAARAASGSTAEATPTASTDADDPGARAGDDGYQHEVLFSALPDFADVAALVEVAPHGAHTAHASPGDEPVVARPERQELSAEDVDRYGLDLFHLAVADEPLPKRRRGW